MLSPHCDGLEVFMAGCLPDLSSPTLGWPFRIVNGVPSVMMPDVPSEISGQGTYEKPWRINLLMSRILR